MTHPGDSQAQRAAEAVILAAAARELESGVLRSRRIELADGVRVEVDGVDEAETVFVEAFARQGRMKPGQVRKVARDILKLTLIREKYGAEVRTVIALASDEARLSIGGWLRFAADSHGVELLVVGIPDDLRESISAAQLRQLMVAADDTLREIAPQPHVPEPGPGQ